MGLPSRAVLSIPLLSLLLALTAWGSVRLFQRGLPFPAEAAGVALALGFAVFYLRGGARLPQKRRVLLSLAGGGAVAYFAAALGGLPALLSYPFDRDLSPGWGPFALALAGGVALGAVLFEANLRAPRRVSPAAPEPPEAPKKPRR